MTWNFSSLFLILVIVVSDLLLLSRFRSSLAVSETILERLNALQSALGTSPPTTPSPPCPTLLPQPTQVSNPEPPPTPVKVSQPPGSQYSGYKAGSAEQYIMDNLEKLGFTKEGAATCSAWTSVESPVHSAVEAYVGELQRYNELLAAHPGAADLRPQLDESYAVCSSVEVGAGGLAALFPSGQLSQTASGWVEPLLPPLRHPLFCTDTTHLLDLKYYVHDFAALCRKLKKTSRTVLVDMGASLDFHGTEQPAVYLTSLFTKFGLPFDHIYAYEITPAQPAHVYEIVPESLLSAYHWINVGVSADPESRLNPLKMLLNNFNEDDLIVIKLDVDTSSIEVPLAYQLLNDERFHKLIDSFYFEHHVKMGELLPWWLGSAEGTVASSYQLFHGLRQKGIAAHSWV